MTCVISMHRGLVSQHTPNLVTIGLSIPELQLSRQFLHPPHFARATCHSGHPDGWVLVPFTVEGMQLPIKEDRLSIGPVVAEI